MHIGKLTSLKSAQGTCHLRNYCPLDGDRKGVCIDYRPGKTWPTDASFSNRPPENVRRHDVSEGFPRERRLEEQRFRPIGFLLTNALLLANCSQITNYTYARKIFTNTKFESDLAACRHQNSSVSAFQTPPPDQRTQLDDATVRDCMKTKGYMIETEAR
jgi:hypothetical protein